jgi:hypothetical protein
MRHREKTTRRAKPSSPGAGTMLVLGVGIGWIVIGIYATVASVTPMYISALGALLLLAAFLYRQADRGEAVVSVERKAQELECRVVRSQPEVKLNRATGSTPKQPEKRTAIAVQRESVPPEKSQAKSDAREMLASRVRAIADCVDKLLSKEPGPTSDQSSYKTALRVQLEALDQLARRLEMIALNAAIEAARAKEYGSGFSIVAKEMRGISEKIKNAVALGKNELKSDLEVKLASEPKTHPFTPIVEELRSLQDELKKDHTPEARDVKDVRDVRVEKAEFTPPPKLVVRRPEGNKVAPSAPNKTALAIPAPVKQRTVFGAASLKNSTAKGGLRLRLGVSSRVSKPKVTPSYEKKSFAPVRSDRTLMSPLIGKARDPSAPQSLGVILLDKGSPTEETSKLSLKLELDDSKLTGGRDEEDEHFERF